MWISGGWGRTTNNFFCWDCGEEGGGCNGGCGDCMTVIGDVALINDFWLSVWFVNFVLI